MDGGDLAREIERQEPRVPQLDDEVIWTNNTGTTVRRVADLSADEIETIDWSDEDRAWLNAF